MIIKKIKEFEENGYTILEDIIPQNEVQLLNLELQESADKFGKNNNGVTYLATTINFCQSFDKYLSYSLHHFYLMHSQFQQ